MHFRSFAFISFLSFAVFGGFRVHSQTPSQSARISAVPSWFARCAGENSTCVVHGTARVIYGSATGNDPAAAGSFVTQIVNGNVNCSDDTFGDPALGQSKACWYGPVEGMPPGQILAAGGSNVPFYVQNAGLWDGNQRHVVGHYNLDPTLVEAELRQLYQSGQRNISLVLWYMPFGGSKTPVDWLYGSAVMDSSGGNLSPLLQNNLTAVLGLIKAVGFTQVTIRFDPFGSASPVSWGNTWNEALFEEDEAFEFNTRQVAEAALSGSSVTRNYDLGIELAGLPHALNADGMTYSDGQSSAWTTRLWADYVKRYGKGDSYGFSIAYAFGALTQAVAEYDTAGTRPSSYGIDDYLGGDLWYIYQELVGAGDTAKSVVLQEVSYNDSAEAQKIQSVLQHFSLTVASVNQWPANNVYGAQGTVPSTNYGAYDGDTVTTGTLTIAPCAIGTGKVTCTTQASWSTSNATNVALFVDGVAVANLPNILTSLSGTANITLGLGSTTLALVSFQGSLASAVQIRSAADLSTGQSLLASQTVTALDPVAPTIITAGVGGPNLQSIWAIGSNLSSGCTVQLYDAAVPGSPAVANLSNAACSPSNLSFALPSFVSTSYSTLNFTVTNPGSSPSAAYTLPIQPIPTLSLAGLGGVNNGIIWAAGKNFTPACSVRLYDPAAPGAEPVVTLGLTCEANSLSFPIPASVQGRYRALSLIVVNSDWQASAPVTFSLQ